MKDSFITVRVPNNTRIKFHTKAADFGNSSAEVLRVLIEAFIEDRLTIQPPSNRKEIYHVA